jgi:putative flippase GtrA
MLSSFAGFSAGLFSGEGLRRHGARAVRFALVSGAGLGLDLGLFVALSSFGAAAFGASCLSSAAAVTFVYAASVRRVFRYERQFVPAMFAAYAFYQLCGILLGSWAVSALVGAGLIPAAAKIAILPVTFSANYLFMFWLTANPQRWFRSR